MADFTAFRVHPGALRGRCLAASRTCRALAPVRRRARDRGAVGLPGFVCDAEVVCGVGSTGVILDCLADPALFRGGETAWISALPVGPGYLGPSPARYTTTPSTAFGTGKLGPSLAFLFRANSA